MRGVKPQDSNRRARGRRKHHKAHPGDHARPTLLVLRALREAWEEALCGATLVQEAHIERR